MAFDKLVLHVTEMSSRWLQSSTPRSRRGQSNSEFSVPSHSTSSSHICPVPAPNVLPMGSPDRLNKTKYRNAVHYHMRSKTYIVLYSVLDYQFRSFEYDKLKLLIIVAVWSCFTGRVYVLGYREVLLHRWSVDVRGALSGCQSRLSCGSEHTSSSHMKNV